MSKRTLNFTSEAEAIAEIERLRRGYTKAGAWSLEQACWHVRLPIQHAVDNAHLADAEPTQEEVQKQQWFQQRVAEARKTGQRLDAPPTMQPAADCASDEPEKLIAALRKLAEWKKSRLPMGPFGPMPLADARGFHLFHIGHHLSYLIPTEAAGAS